MIKILHAADLHLDSAFAALTGAQAAQRRREQRAALDRLAQLAADCDLVLLAGDLFDGARVYRDTLDALAQDTPLCRNGTPDDVARAISYLCSDAAAFVTGHTLSVNGGFVIV